MQPHESHVARRLDGADLGLVVRKLEVLELGLGVGLVARPFELGGPREVAEPVALEQ